MAIGTEHRTCIGGVKLRDGLQMIARLLDVEKLYLNEHGRLRALVRRILRNPSAADDLVQQAFVNILARLHNDAASANPAYVRAAVRNLALNHLRDMKKRSELEIAGIEVDDVADLRPTPEIIVLYRSELRRLLSAIAALPPRRREAFVLNRIEGLSYDEIAERMHISRNTVISSIVNAMAELDRKLGE